MGFRHYPFATASIHQAAVELLSEMAISREESRLCVCWHVVISLDSHSCLPESGPDGKVVFIVYQAEGNCHNSSLHSLKKLFIVSTNTARAR